MDPLSGDPHVTWAIYCIALALIVSLLLLAEVIVNKGCDVERHRGSKT
jgi:hypothetical protein